MPSIPQSLLWISLVVLWLFVLVPMLVSKREAVRRTSDVALAARVLTSGAGARLLRRTGPATGHASDPDWRRDYCEREAEDELPFKPGGSTAVAEADQPTRDDYLDVDVIDEDPGTPPVAESVDESAADLADQDVDVARPVVDEQVVDEDDPAPAEAEAEGADDDDGGAFEYVEDTSGLEADEPASDAAPTASPESSAERRRRAAARAEAAVTERKYRFRKRVLATMILTLAVSGALAYTAVPSAWRLCAGVGALTVLYLAYLRRQTRIEQQVRARRANRRARTRVETPEERRAPAREPEVTRSRLHRPGAAVLDIDDEDPAFDHLSEASFARDYDWRGDLLRAAGQ